MLLSCSEDGLVFPAVKDVLAVWGKEMESGFSRKSEWGANAFRPLGVYWRVVVGARQGPSALQSWATHRAARHSQATRMVMDLTLLVGLQRRRPSLSWSCGIGVGRCGECH
jgi:hypothetical protein